MGAYACLNRAYWFTRTRREIVGHIDREDGLGGNTPLAAYVTILKKYTPDLKCLCSFFGGSVSYNNFVPLFILS